jgi:hypothetical protein
MGGHHLKGHITDPRNIGILDTNRRQRRMEEMSRRPRRIKASSEEGQGPEGTVAP